MAAEFVASEWRETRTAFVWRGEQGTALWHYWRRGRITASIISKVANRSLYHAWNKQSNTGLSKAILGVEGFSTGPEKPNEAMKWGLYYEPIARKYLAEILRLEDPIQEVGLAIDKGHHHHHEEEEEKEHAPPGLFAASPDGLVNSKVGVEIKCPQYMPDWAILRAVDKKTPIDMTWMDQIQMTGAVYGLEAIWLFVMPKFKAKGVLNSTAAEKVYFLEEVAIDLHHWRMLRHKALAFYRTYMAPLVAEDPLLRPAPVLELVHEHARGHKRKHREEDQEGGEDGGARADILQVRPGKRAP